ncbi:MAG: 30S ribosomal protein S21 [Chloroflexi bacterium]|nr:30S ribosomal protein S21 [Chloroflexota bacterium]
MMQVKLHEGEAFESLLKRFRSGVAKHGILRDVRRHESFMSRGEKQRQKARRAQRRRLSKQLRRAA